MKIKSIILLLVATSLSASCFANQGLNIEDIKIGTVFTAKKEVQKDINHSALNFNFGKNEECSFGTSSQTGIESINIGDKFEVIDIWSHSSGAPGLMGIGLSFTGYDKDVHLSDAVYLECHNDLSLGKFREASMDYFKID